MLIKLERKNNIDYLLTCSLAPKVRCGAVLYFLAVDSI